MLKTSSLCSLARAGWRTLAVLLGALERREALETLRNTVTCICSALGSKIGVRDGLKGS